MNSKLSRTSSSSFSDFSSTSSSSDSNDSIIININTDDIYSPLVFTYSKILPKHRIKVHTESSNKLESVQKPSLSLYVSDEDVNCFDTDYINEDENPDLISKDPKLKLEYMETLAIRYLKPPSPSPPPPIIIKQLPNTSIPLAPPIIIRQKPVETQNPFPLIHREVPPSPPPHIGTKVITIKGKHLPPPPRRVVIERLPQLPVKSKSILVERWLPYPQVKRKVIYKNAAEADFVYEKPKNVIIQWESPKVVIKKKYKYLGVVETDPVEYVKQYGSSLIPFDQLPDFVFDIKTPEGLVLAGDKADIRDFELEGDVHALDFIDVDKEGLKHFSDYLKKLEHSRIFF